MNSEPEQLRRDIERTQRGLSADVDALTEMSRTFADATGGRVVAGGELPIGGPDPPAGQPDVAGAVAGRAHKPTPGLNLIYPHSTG